MNSQRGITLLLMILIVLVLTVGTAAISAQISADVRAARSYLEEAKAFYVAWGAVANGRTWMTSGARRTQVGSATPCSGGSNGTTCEQIANRDVLPDATPDFHYGDRSFTFELQAPDNINAVYGDGRIKVVGDYPGSDRSAADPRSLKALLEIIIWRDMKAYAENFSAVNREPARAIDGSTTTWTSSNSPGSPSWIYFDFGQVETVNKFVFVVSSSGMYPFNATAVASNMWSDTSSPPNWAAIPGGTTVSGQTNVPAGKDTITVTFGAVSTRRIRLALDPNAGFSAGVEEINLCNVAVITNACTAASTENVRRQGSVRPGRFSFSTTFSHTQFQ